MTYDEYLQRMKESAKEAYFWYYKIHNVLKVADEAKADLDGVSYIEWQWLCQDAKHIIGAIVHEDMKDIQRTESVRIEM